MVGWDRGRDEIKRAALVKTRDALEVEGPEIISWSGAFGDADPDDGESDPLPK